MNQTSRTNDCGLKNTHKARRHNMYLKNLNVGDRFKVSGMTGTVQSKTICAIYVVIDKRYEVDDGGHKVRGIINKYPTSFSRNTVVQRIRTKDVPAVVKSNLNKKGVDKND